MIKLINKFLANIIVKDMNTTTSDVYNSIRINAIVNELVNSGIITTDSINNRIKSDVLNLVSRRAL